ncbi:hypothetical protein BDB01DRAFT_172522 [Pilobolus umbonatus]|nr:hypothetical protein BDB01DRAFT_172522 [Pilobolus umbonatus]
MFSKGSKQADTLVTGGKSNVLLQQNNLKNLLNRAIKFRKSRYVDPKLEKFKQKFTPINSTTGVVHVSTGYTNEAMDNISEKIDANGFENPGKILYSRDKLSSTWEQIHPVGGGLKDLGHLSSLNTVLQAITYTPALANYMVNKSHSPNCTVQDYCFVCALEEHVKLMLKGSPYAIQPRLFAGKLKKMKTVTTKDALNLWNFFMEQIQSFLLIEKGSKDKRIQETTALYQIFGGYIQDKLTCSSCNVINNVYQSCLYLSLDIMYCNSIDKCLKNYFSKDISQQMECTRYCHENNPFKGKRSIYRPPMTLVMHLNRMNEDTDHTINTRKISFNDTLDIKQYVTATEQNIESKYNLYAAIIYTGNTINDGHYIVYVKGSNGAWYCMYNETVQQVSLKRLLNENPYMLFYTMNSKPPTRNKPITIKTKPATEGMKPREQLNSVESEDEEEIIDEQEEEEKEEKERLKKALDEVVMIDKVENTAAIVVAHDENMKNKREKLNSLIEKESVENKSLDVKNELLTTATSSQYLEEVVTWDEDAAAVKDKRSQIMKQLKTKRKKTDLYDMEYDRGKIKKIKAPKEDKFHKPNLFQATAEKKNKQNKYRRK